MADPLIRLRRKPLLTPLLIPLLAVLAAGAGIYALGVRAKTTTVIVLRHAEVAAGDAADPDLSPAGEQRVSRLGELIADVLPEGRVDYLYAGDSRRAQQTALPIANHFKLPVNLIASSDWPALAARIRREHRGRTVVVVGYASTLPGVLSQLSSRTVAIGEDEFDSMYVAVIPSPGETKLLRVRYGPQGGGDRKAGAGTK